MGGWTLSDHHFYDVKGNMLHLGSGESRRADPGIAVVTRVLGSGGGETFAVDGTSATTTGTGIPKTNPSLNYGVAGAPNGDIFFVDAKRRVVRRIDAQGKVSTVAGIKDEYTCGSGNRGDGGPALQARFNTPRDVAVGPDGSLYITDPGDDTVRRARPSGSAYVMETVAGTPCMAGSVGDGGKAINARLSNPQRSAIGPDGSLYIADRGNSKIRRVDPNGNISTIAGNGGTTYNRADEGKIAITAAIGTVEQLAVGPDGTVFSFNNLGRNLFSVTPDGKIHYLTAAYASNNVADEGVALATEAVEAMTFGAMAVLPNRSVLFTDRDSRSVSGEMRAKIRVADASGIVRTLSSGLNSGGSAPAGGPCPDH